MSKCRRNISYNIQGRLHEKKHNNIPKIQNNQGRQRKSSFFTLPQIVKAVLFCLLLALTNHFSPVNCKLTRKTYTVWDLTPEEFENLLEQEKALQKRKRNIDYFLRRRAKKTKELLPLEGYEKEGSFSETSNNLGKLNDVTPFSFRR